MFSRFFINRPVFATVISIVIVLSGGITLFVLPVEQYPDITPPTVEISTSYPGADAKVVADTVATPIEQEVNGVENMIYMSSSSTSDGKMTLTVTFEVGTDLDMAQVLVQNRVAIAEPKLPEEVKRQGITTKKKSTSMTLALCVFSPDGKYDELFLSNYATKYIKDELSRVPGVGDVSVFGTSEYGMRIWLDPNKLAARGLTTSDILGAIREQNVQVAAGQIGQPPTPPGQNFQYTITTTGRLANEEQFEDIIVKTGADGQIVRLKDVARIELGAESYNWFSQLNGKPCATIMVYQLPGANALNVADGVRKAVYGKDGKGGLAEDFPEGLDCDVVYDFTDFVKASIREVVETLFIAVVLVVLSVYIFLQDLRTTLIPALTIPVSLIGTLGVMMALGFSINTLSLFGLVLVIGIVVDDAIVVVENTVRLMENEGLPSKEATAKAMEEVTGPVIATTLVLLAVFLPTAFFPGITGQLYRQFALTISAATCLSSLNALTLSPAMCGLLLQPSMVKLERVMMFLLKLCGPALIGLWLDTKGTSPLGFLGIEHTFLLAGIVLGVLLTIVHFLRKPTPAHGWFFRGFNWGFEHSTNGYMVIVNVLVRRLGIIMLLFVGLLVATGFGFTKMPTGFIPNEDQGYFIVNIQLPDAASRERTEAVVKRVEETSMKMPGAKDSISFSGYSLLDANVSSNMGSLLVTLKPWDERTSREEHVGHIVAALNREFQDVQEAIVFAFPPPPIQGIGMAGGFELKLQDRVGGQDATKITEAWEKVAETPASDDKEEPSRQSVGPGGLQEIANDVVQEANADPLLTDVTTRIRASVPQLFVKIDRTKVKKHGVPQDEVFHALQANLGSVYVNDFNKFGRIYKVMVQADQPFRNQVEDIALLKVRNDKGKMIPLTSVVTVLDSVGPQKIDHYQLYAAATVNGMPATGVSSGQAVKEMERICEDKLPQSMGYDWTGMTYQEIKAGNLAPIIFSLALIFAYLFLAAQYESYSIPLAVILSVPLAMLGALVGVWFRGMDVNVYTQIGLVLLIALSSKNAILIVEFAKQQSEQGKSPVDAAVEASRLRFRPILMTAFSFILGIIPLVIASGAGAESRKALGTAVFGGMLAATFFGVFLVPVLYVVVRRTSDWLPGNRVQGTVGNSKQSLNGGQRSGGSDASPDMSAPSTS